MFFLYDYNAIDLTVGSCTVPAKSGVLLSKHTVLSKEKHYIVLFCYNSERNLWKNMVVCQCETIHLVASYVMGLKYFKHKKAKY